MKVPIEPGTTVGALLDAYPDAENVLIDLAPAFARLRNPVVRRTVAKVATLEQAAKIGGVSLHVLIQRLRAFTGQSDTEMPLAAAADNCAEAPSWVADGRIVEEINAAALL